MSIRLGCTQPRQMFVSERIFIALADQFVLKNDTVKIMGQLLSTDYNDFYPYSRYVYVELIDRHKQVVERKKIRCNDNGAFFTSILYLTRVQTAYTTYVATHNSCAIAKAISTPWCHFMWVSCHKSKKRRKNICGVLSRRRSSGKGACSDCWHIYLQRTQMPSATNFVILNSRRDTICSGKTDTNGLASISFIPDGNRYLLSTETDDKATHNFLLPETMQIPTLRTAVNRKRLVCYVLTDTDDKEPIDSLEIAIYHSSFGIKSYN